MSWAAFVSFIISNINLLLGALKGVCRFLSQKISPPDCTFEDLKNYIAEDLSSDSPQLDSFLVGLDQGWTDYGFLNDFLYPELFKGKIGAWGKRVKDGRISPRETRIPKEYWEFNRVRFLEEGIDPSPSEEVLYTDIRFNRKQVIKQLELFYNRETS